MKTTMTLLVAVAMFALAACDNGSTEDNECTANPSAPNCQVSE